LKKFSHSGPRPKEGGGEKGEKKVGVPTHSTEFVTPEGKIKGGGSLEDTGLENLKVKKGRNLLARSGNGG